jgi:6,7-dimethyl-8-ribityllumazine synthase
VEGTLDAKGLKLKIAVARWNPTITQALLASALESLERCGARAGDVSIVKVAGAFELPAAVRALMRAGRTDAVIVLGAIIKGETRHDEVLGHAVATALAGLSAETGIPIGFGLLTCETVEQARARSGKGTEAVEAAVEMANVRRRLKGR